MNTYGNMIRFNLKNNRRACLNPATLLVRVIDGTTGVAVFRRRCRSMRTFSGWMARFAAQHARAVAAA